MRGPDLYNIIRPLKSQLYHFGGIQEFYTLFSKAVPGQSLRLGPGKENPIGLRGDGPDAEDIHRGRGVVEGPAGRNHCQRRGDRGDIDNRGQRLCKVFRRRSENVLNLRSGYVASVQLHGQRVGSRDGGARIGYDGSVIYRIIYPGLRNREFGRVCRMRDGAAVLGAVPVKNNRRSVCHRCAGRGIRR